MNRLILHGRMTADPRVKYGEDENHTCFARWTMAVEDRSWKVDDTFLTMKRKAERKNRRNVLRYRITFLMGKYQRVRPA